MAEKVTLESLDGRMGKTDERLDSIDRHLDKTDERMARVESDVGTLKSDVGTLKSDVGTLKSDVGTLKSDVGTLKPQMVEVIVAVHRLQTDVKDLSQRMDEMGESLGEQLEEISLQTRSMTSAVWEALNQLTLSRTYEKRLDRLETAVFGKVGD